MDGLFLDRTRCGNVKRASAQARSIEQRHFFSFSVRSLEVNAGGVTNFCSIELQMRLLYENETVTEGVRLGRRGEILATARDALESTLGAMPALGLCVSSGENELHREK